MKNVYLKALGKDVKVYEHGDPDVISVGDIVRAMEYVCSESKALGDLATISLSLKSAIEKGKTLSDKKMNEIISSAQNYIDKFAPYSEVVPQYREVIAAGYEVIARCYLAQAQGKEMEALDKTPDGKPLGKAEQKALLGEAKGLYQQALDVYTEKKEVAPVNGNRDDKDIADVQQSLNEVAESEQKLEAPKAEKSEGKKGFFARLRGK